MVLTCTLTIIKLLGYGFYQSADGPKHLLFFLKFTLFKIQTLKLQFTLYKLKFTLYKLKFTLHFLVVLYVDHSGHNLLI